MGKKVVRGCEKVGSGRGWLVVIGRTVTFFCTGILNISPCPKGPKYERSPKVVKRGRAEDTVRTRPEKHEHAYIAGFAVRTFDDEMV